VLQDFEPTRKSGIPHISLKQIAVFEIPFPPSDDELAKIADCLASFDQLLAAQTERIDALKLHKKGLMQQLFPQMSEPTSDEKTSILND
jgi:type I restriction enzyme, S subunit